MSAKPASQQLRNQAKAYVNSLEQALKQISPEITDLEEAKNTIYKFLKEKSPQVFIFYLIQCFSSGVP